MSEHQDVAKQELFAGAAAQIGPDTHIGDQLNYIRSYYGHVDSADVIAAGERRTAGVAVEHAALAAQRPQGRAPGRVTAGGQETLLPSRDVIDVVTDDMPFLVDTITMTLAAHDVTPELVVHPQLMVRRDLSGALREVLGPVDGPRRPDQLQPPVDREPELLAESWSHIEVPKLT